jgi:hypothetical protein
MKFQMVIFQEWVLKGSPMGFPGFPQCGNLGPLSLTHTFLFSPGVFAKPSLSAHPGPAVSPGGDVTLQCQTQYSFDQFALYKEGDTGPYKVPERWYQADFPIITVTSAHSGTYRCYSFSSSSPYLWSAPSNPLVLVVTGKRVQTQAFVLGLGCSKISSSGEQGEPHVPISVGRCMRFSQLL